MKKYILTILASLCGVAVASPLPSGATLRSSNTVEAEFVNIVHLPCPRHKNRPCPSSCHMASESVVLRVTANEEYVKNGRYADAKITPGQTLTIDLNKEVPGQNDADVHDRLSKLKTGDKVRITIRQYYVEVRGVQATHRPAIIEEVIPAEDQLTEE